MGISSAIANANTGLAAAQRRADLVSNNIANALTPGYARRDIEVAERATAGQGNGVAVVGITRAGDAVLARERRGAEGTAAHDATLAETYQTFNASLGEADDPFSLFGQYQALETALRGLGESPESRPQQAATLDAAKALASALNRLTGQTQRTREDADREIAQSVTFVNNSLKQIEKLNGDISRAANVGRDTSSLVDQRALLIDDVSRLIPVREVAREAGAVDLLTSEGTFLIAGKARQLSFSPTGVITADLAYNNGAGVLSGLSVDGIDLTPGGPGAFAARQGGLAGLFAVRDVAAPGFQAQLDSLAGDLLQRFEGVDATIAPTDPGLFTDNGLAFDPLAEQGLAGRITINIAVDPAAGGVLSRLRDGLGAVVEGPAGDAAFARTLLDTFTAKRALSAGSGIAGVSSAAQAAADISSAIGAARIGAETSLAASRARAAAVTDVETELVGVDTDAELQKLLVIEQAFAANARVIQTAQALIATLLEIF